MQRSPERNRTMFSLRPSSQTTFHTIYVITWEKEKLFSCTVLTRVYCVSLSFFYTRCRFLLNENRKKNILQSRSFGFVNECASGLLIRMPILSLREIFARCQRIIIGRLGGFLFWSKQSQRIRKGEKNPEMFPYKTANQSEGRYCMSSFWSVEFTDRRGRRETCGD